MLTIFIKLLNHFLFIKKIYKQKIAKQLHDYQHDSKVIQKKHRRVLRVILF